MDLHEIVQQLVSEDARHINKLTKDCGSCRKFIHRLRRKPWLEIGWDDIPGELLERFSSQWHQRLFLY